MTHREPRIIAWANEEVARDMLAVGQTLENHPCIQPLGDGVVAIWDLPYPKEPDEQTQTRHRE